MRVSNRERLLEAGLKLIHEHGFAGASVRDIVQAAGVPQGSFTNHFASKEAFGLEIIEIYFARARTLIEETLRNDARPPLDRLRAWLEANKHMMGRDSCRNGCLIGNFSAEAGEHGEPILRRLGAIFGEMEAAVRYCLDAAATAGDIPADIDRGALAGFIVSSLQGAILLAKAQRSVAPIERFERILFSAVLR